MLNTKNSNIEIYIRYLRIIVSTISGRIFGDAFRNCGFAAFSTVGMVIAVR